MYDQLALAGLTIQMFYCKLMLGCSFRDRDLQIFRNGRAPAEENTHYFPLRIPLMGLCNCLAENLVPVWSTGMEILVVLVLAHGTSYVKSVLHTHHVRYQAMLTVVSVF